MRIGDLRAASTGPGRGGRARLCSGEMTGGVKYFASNRSRWRAVESGGHFFVLDKPAIVADYLVRFRGSLKGYHMYEDQGEESDV